MARKKKNTLDDLKNFDTSRLFSGDKSYMSLIYGIVTVVVIFIIIFLGVRAISQRNVEVTEEAPQTEEQGRTVTVEEGDNLWTIAEEAYNDGYKWSLIAEANDLDSPDDIETGMVLTIPDVSEEEESTTEETAMEEETEEASETAMEESEETEAPTTSPTQAATPAPATGGKGAAAGKAYTVAEGDSLWTIAEKTYNDGYRWVDIARANNIVNPDLIYPGDQYTLPQ